MKLMSKTYRYNSKLVQTIMCNYIPYPMDKGYEALTGVMEKVEEKQVAYEQPSSYDAYDSEEQKLVYLQKFIDKCNTNNIKLIMCYSPYYGQTIPRSICMIEELAELNNVLFLNYGDDVRFQNHKYFQDASHLNDIGAIEYSKEITITLNQLSY